MVEMQRRTDFSDKVFTQVARHFPNPEAERAETAVPNNPVHREFITNFALPDEIVQILTNAFELLGLQLEPLETYNPLFGDSIQHHKVKSAAGDIALIYSEANLLRTEDKVFIAQLNSLGMLFSKNYSSIFIFSHAGNTSFRYKEMVRQWIEDLEFFSRAELFLEDAINEFKNSDANAVANLLRVWLGLSEQAGDRTKVKSAINKVKLSSFIDDAFNDKELRTLCFDLQDHDLEYDDLEGDAKDRKIIELIGHFERRGILKLLIDYCKEKRPNYSWDEV